MNLEALRDLIVVGTDSDVADAYAALAERAETAVFGFEEEVCLVDVETTGFEVGRDRLIEVAAAIMRGPVVVDRMSSLVDPLVPIPLEITRLTGIDDELVAGAPAAHQVVSDLSDFAGGRPLVAHHAAFDRSFLGSDASPGALSATWYDTLVLTRIALPRLRSHRLVDLAAAFAPEASQRAHRAADDVEVLTRIWRIALVGLSDLDAGLLGRLVGLAPGADWPERELLARIAGAQPPVAYDLKALRRGRVAADRADALADADEADYTCPDPSVVAAAFAADGLAGRMYSGFEERAEQSQMAEVVREAFCTRTHAAIEAGTGVGKSLAYLVPGALFATGSGVGVGVATKTNALMDQLVYHELPKLQEALGTPLRYAALKGYEHYVCLRKLERVASALDDNTSADDITTVAMLLAWVSQSSWGDLDVVNLHWFRDQRAAVQASSADCTNRRCRYYPNLCYLHGVRRRASSAHIVVTNHALLFRDVVAGGQILPPIRHWVIDEAHSAESEARKQLTVQASYLEMSSALDSLHGSRGSAIDALRRLVAGTEGDEELDARLSALKDEVRRTSTLAGSMFEFVKDLSSLGEDRDYDAADLWLNANIRETGPWGVVASTGRSLARRLEAILALGRDIITRLEQAGAETGDARADLAGLMTRIADQHAGLVSVIDGEDTGMVYWAAIDRRASVHTERLVAARLDVGETLAEDFYPRVHSAIFTSATIATADSFDHFARSVGLDLLEPSSWRAVKLASSYDFERQMAVYVPLGIAEPAGAGYLADLEELLVDVHTAMDGSVLTLFTNRRDMERLHARVEPRLRARGLDLIMQRRGTSAKRLRDEFIADRRLSLFALKSFWEGFDAKGDTLRCVVIPKLPFGRPTDPLSQERNLREGRSAWKRYVLPEAIIELKQAAGRLIRSSTDVGCLVIADARVTSKFYGRDFLAALPVADVERVDASAIADVMSARFRGA